MTDASPEPSQQQEWAAVLADLREHVPLVQCLTNYVSMDLAANLLNAAGASPAMVHDENEAAEMAGLAAAVCVNIGTLSPPWVAGMTAAATVAGERGIPWVLDPVAVGATGYRRRAAADLLDLAPTVVRGNASEIAALAGEVGADGGGRGVDATADSLDVVDAARALALERGCVVVVSGAVDVVVDGGSTTLVHGGDPRMPLISALGCSASALVAACCAVAPRPVDGAVTAMAMLAAAGERAGGIARGPGTLRMHLLDELAALDGAALAGVRVERTGSGR